MFDSGEDGSMSSQAKTTTARETEVESAFAVNDSESKILADVLSVLGQRLQSVLRSEEIDAPSEKESLEKSAYAIKSAYNTPLASRINRNTVHMRELRNTVEKILAKLEI
jgi:hypothetical protein